MKTPGKLGAASSTHRRPYGLLKVSWRRPRNRREPVGHRTKMVKISSFTCRMGPGSDLWKPFYTYHLSGDNYTDAFISVKFLLKIATRLKYCIVCLPLLLPFSGMNGSPHIFWVNWSRWQNPILKIHGQFVNKPQNFSYQKYLRIQLRINFFLTQYQFMGVNNTVS